VPVLDQAKCRSVADRGSPAASAHTGSTTYTLALIPMPRQCEHHYGGSSDSDGSGGPVAHVLQRFPNPLLGVPGRSPHPRCGSRPRDTVRLPRILDWSQ